MSPQRQKKKRHFIVVDRQGWCHTKSGPSTRRMPNLNPILSSRSHYKKPNVTSHSNAVHASRQPNEEKARICTLQGSGLLGLSPEEDDVQRGASEPLRPHRRVQPLRGTPRRTLYDLDFSLRFNPPRPKRASAGFCVCFFLCARRHQLCTQQGQRSVVLL